MQPFPAEIERDANSIRLSIFLDKVIQQFGQQETAHELEQLPEALQAVAKSITTTAWVSAVAELAVIQRLCERFGAWDLLQECGRDAAAAHIYSNQAFLSGSLEEVVFQIPSLIAQFTTHLHSFVRKSKNDAWVHVRHRDDAKPHAADLLFVAGLLRGILSYDRAMQCQVTLEQCVLSPSAWPPASETPAQFESKDNVYRIVMPNADTLEAGGERKDQQYVRQVLQRSSELLQDKRELLTAVEYLNMANDQLEKKIKANRQELLMARNIQKGFVPPRIPDWKGMQFWVKFFPLTEVSGDFYDYFSLGSRKFGLLVCDVSGHGVPAALISAIAKI
ncbi:MAG: hypothetical protein HY042_03155, partial [Spirochaetia bacterium]|nr:hypothetical protein [Spirochaetia bacterium]